MSNRALMPDAPNQPMREDKLGINCTMASAQALCRTSVRQRWSTSSTKACPRGWKQAFIDIVHIDDMMLSHGYLVQAPLDYSLPVLWHWSPEPLIRESKLGYTVIHKCRIEHLCAMPRINSLREDKLGLHCTMASAQPLCRTSVRLRWSTSSTKAALEAGSKRSSA